MENNATFRSNKEKRYKNLLKTLSILFLITAILLGIVCFMFVLDVGKTISILTTKSNTCTTKACIKAAHTILENIDPSVDPCEDFHAFSCGSFLKTKRIPDDQTKLDVFDLLRNDLAYQVADILSSKIDDSDIESTKNAKRLYHSCMNEEILLKIGEGRFKSILAEELDGWPLIGIPSNSKSTILEKMVKFRKFSIKPLIDLQITLNPKDPQYLILKVKQPNWFFNKVYYNQTNFVEAYKNYMYKYISSLNSSIPDLKEQIQRLFNLEKYIVNNLSSDEHRNSTHKIFTIAELSKEVPDFNWSEFLINGIFREIHNVTINESEPLIVDDINYIRFISNLIKEYSENSENSSNKTDLENLMVWSFIKNDVTFLPRKYKEIKLEFDKVYKGTKSIISRQITCSNYVIEVMEFAVGRLYVSKHFNPESKMAASEMIDNIRKEFIQILKETDWLDDESRSLALAKADNIDSKVGYPDFIYNNTHLNNMYKNFTMNDTEFLYNSFKISKYESLNGFNELRIKRDRKLWISGPAIVNAFYSPFVNQICFPAGILQSPFYDSQAPNYLNYGGIGSVIGHEITHGFDDRGRLHDKNGVYHADGNQSLWTNRTVQKYKEKAKCIINQYHNYHVKQINETLNGIKTQGENIADNGGIKESYRAYQNWVKRNGEEKLLPGVTYNQNQLFFINYAQVWCTKHRSEALKSRVLNSNHSPGEFRIIGPTSNSEDFAKVFKCKLGQKNNPVKKCSVW